jgi:plasmid replication initiation protein
MRKNTALEKVKKYDVVDLDRPVGQRWVTLSNALTRAGQGLSLTEKRLIMLAVSKLDSFKPVPFGVSISTKISAAEYVEAFEVDINTAYDQLQSGAKNLYNRSILFFTPAHKRNGQPIENQFKRNTMRWVGRVEYDKGGGMVELFWWHEVLPHLTAIKKHFTSYQLKQTSALRSVYSWRLLELLMKYKNTGRAEYTIDDFHTSMDVPPSFKGDFGQLKRRVIEPAVRELNDKDNWLLHCEPIKKGRKVTRLVFTFQPNPQLDLFKPNH